MRASIIGLFWLMLTTPCLGASFTAQLNLDGDQVEIRFVLKDARGQDGAEPRFPDFKGLKRVSGPAVGTSLSVVNGAASSEKSWTFQFTPTSDSPVRVGPANIQVGDQILSTQPLTVPGRTQTRATGDRPARLSLEWEPRRPLVGQAVHLKLRLDFKVNVRGYDPPALPSTPGFIAEPLPRQGQPEITTRTIGGETWNTAILAEWLLFPVRDGRLKLDPISLQIQVDEPRKRGRDPFDFFGSSMFNQLKTLALSTDAQSMEVSPLPAGAPAEFQGAVGSFSLKAAPDKSSLKAGEALTLTVTLEGRGNFGGLQAPTLSHSPDLERYDTQTEGEISSGARGQQGRRRFKTLLVPRLPGEQRIDEVVFAYYDPAAGSYRRVSAGPWIVQVEPGVGGDAGSGVVRMGGGDQVQSYGKDIRHVLPAPKHLSRREAPPHHRWPWLLSLGLTLSLLPGSMLLAGWLERRRQAEPRLRGRGALRQARRTLAARPGQSATQEEVLRTYLATRLRRSATGLLLEDALRDLAFRGAGDEIRTELERTWKLLEFNRYGNGKALPEAELLELLQRLDAWFEAGGGR